MVCLADSAALLTCRMPERLSARPACTERADSKLRCSYWDFTRTLDDKQELPLPAPGAMLCGDVTPSERALWLGGAHGAANSVALCACQRTSRQHMLTRACLLRLGCWLHMRPAEICIDSCVPASKLAGRASLHAVGHSIGCPHVCSPQAATTLLRAATTPRCTSTTSSSMAMGAWRWRQGGRGTGMGTSH